MGGGPGRRAEPHAPPAARRHHRGDAAVRQSQAVAGSAIHRCLKPHDLSARLTPEKAPAIAFETDTPAGFVHIDVKYLAPLKRHRSYAYVAIDRATCFVYLEILPD